jgi:hypothetical protein
MQPSMQKKYSRRTAQRTHAREFCARANNAKSLDLYGSQRLRTAFAKTKNRVSKKDSQNKRIN